MFMMGLQRVKKNLNANLQNIRKLSVREVVFPPLSTLSLPTKKPLKAQKVNALDSYMSSMQDSQ